MSLSKIQKTVLNVLLDIYENSAAYKGTSVKNQSFSVKPEKVFCDYDGDYTDHDVVKQFNQEMLELETHKFVFLNYIKGTTVIDKIKLNPASLTDIYMLLGREDITLKRCREIELYLKYIGLHRILDNFCNEQIERLRNYKNAAFTSDIAVNILELLRYILGNTQDIMERELSIAVLGDTKLFENRYRSRVCKIIEECGNQEWDLSAFESGVAKERAILEEYHVFSNPSYVFFKGDVEIYYDDGTAIHVTPANSIAVISEAMSRINMVKINSDRIVTVENLTSYNRISDKTSAFIYLSGYHNTAKQSFFKKIAECNGNVSWYHFGDIDPDGYYILKNLIEKTGIKFTPMYMDIEQLKEYKKYCKPLERNDIVKAQSLINSGFYDEIMNFMLENNCKLEQEIISWKLGQSGQVPMARSKVEKWSLE